MVASAKLLQRAVQAVRYLSKPRTADELGRHLGITERTTHRLLGALQEAGLVKRSHVLKSSGPGQPAHTYVATATVTAKRR